MFITADKPPMHGGLSAALSWFGGALVLASNGGTVSAWVGCIRLLYSTNWANYATLPRQATTQNTTTTHNNQHATAALPTSGFGPLSPWQHPPWT